MGFINDFVKYSFDSLMLQVCYSPKSQVQVKDYMSEKYFWSLENKLLYNSHKLAFIIAQVNLALTMEQWGLCQSSINTYFVLCV